MQPTSESLKLESEGGFVKYSGSGLLKDKKVIVTGGDSGIGRAVAAQMAREGADIAIVYLPEEEPDAKDTKKLVEEAGRKCLTVPFDLMDLKGCEKIVKQIADEFGGRIDVLVNNASKASRFQGYTSLY